MELVIIGVIIACTILLTFAEDGKFDEWQERRHIDRLADRSHSQKGKKKRCSQWV